MKAECVDGVWTFSDAADDHIFSSEDMDQETASKVVAAMSAHDLFISLARQVMTLAEQAKIYDNPVSPAHIANMTRLAESALTAASVNVQAQITLCSRKS